MRYIISNKKILIPHQIKLSVYKFNYFTSWRICLGWEVFKKKGVTCELTGKALNNIAILRMFENLTQAQ